MPDWIFQAVPKTYDLLAALRDKQEDLWTARQQPKLMRSGQTVYFWFGAPVGGIVAIGKIVGSAEPEESSAEQLAYWRETAGMRKTAVLMRVPVIYEQKFPESPLRRANLKEYSELRDQSPIGGFFAATNFPLSAEASLKLAALARSHVK